MPSAPTQTRLNRVKYNPVTWERYRVSPHFTLGEFFRDHPGAPSDVTMWMVRHFCINILEVLRDRHGVCVVVSGYRSRARNRAVGGAPNSWHIWESHPGEMGVDVAFKSGTPDQWAATAARTVAGGIGVYTRHLHVDSRDQRTTWRVNVP